MKVFKSALASVAVASFALAQPAAAATRSYESLPASGVQKATADRAGAQVAGAEELRGAGGGVIGVVLIFAVLLAIFAAAGLFDSGKDSTG